MGSNCATGILMLFIISLFSCDMEDCSENTSIAVDCNFEKLGTRLYSSNDDSQWRRIIPNVVSPGMDSVNHLVFGLEIENINTKELIPFVIESYSCQIYTSDGIQLFESQNFKTVSGFCFHNLLHLWDLSFEGDPYYGEFFVDAEFKTEDEQSVFFKGVNFNSISCESFENCFKDDGECDLTFCLYTALSTYQYCGWNPPSNPSILNCN